MGLLDDIFGIDNEADILKCLAISSSKVIKEPIFASNTAVMPTNVPLLVTKTLSMLVDGYLDGTFLNTSLGLYVKKQLKNRTLSPHRKVFGLIRPLIYEAALISKDVYRFYNADLVGGWRMSNLKISGVVFCDKTGLVSNLYERTNREGKQEYIYAMAGTNPLNFQDWKTDIMQLVGKVEQYENALRNARLISNKVKSNKLTFVGHSLGGGEAAYCAMKIGRDAITFNPAGVQGVSKGQKNIESYIDLKDPLNIAQDMGLVVIPQADGIRHYLKSNSFSLHSNHSIDTIIETLRKHVILKY